MADGLVTAAISDSYDLDHVAQAIHHLADGRIAGKALITIDPPG